MAEHTVHLGEKVKRVREMLGVKQDALAIELGDDWNQKKVSMLEAKAEIEPALLEKVANALKVPKKVIENFDTEQAINVFSGTFTYHDNDNVSLNGTVTNIISNPMEKILELHREKEALLERSLKEKEALYERMLKEKDEMIARLESLLKK
ncbi:XRE family transcriptional regulator [Danxiaibacter flavus]|uniref:XRE family transcriptional regulator n=1 Tax=Danxiaibacter flavus TaxID=3049108 RepID=A0ABV3ZJN3_9BACT|nr:XRE family transcriptional regulator [Chitinophagaceae bacterium DXS]